MNHSIHLSRQQISFVRSFLTELEAKEKWPSIEGNDTITFTESAMTYSDYTRLMPAWTRRPADETFGHIVRIGLLPIILAGQGSRIYELLVRRCEGPLCVHSDQKDAKLWDKVVGAYDANNSKCNWPGYLRFHDHQADPVSLRDLTSALIQDASKDLWWNSTRFVRHVSWTTKRSWPKIRWVYNLFALFVLLMGSLMAGLLHWSTWIIPLIIIVTLTIAFVVCFTYYWRQWDDPAPPPSALDAFLAYLPTTTDNFHTH